MVQESKDVKLVDRAYLNPHHQALHVFSKHRCSIGKLRLLPNRLYQLIIHTIFHMETAETRLYRIWIRLLQCSFQLLDYLFIHPQCLELYLLLLCKL